MLHRVLPLLAALGLTAVAIPSAHAADYLGCWSDDGNRALDGFLGYNHTVESCVAAARSAGYDYAGLQYYGQCFGGNEIGYQQRPEAECSTPCIANGNQTCGGPWRNSIYATGVRPSTCVKDGMFVSCAGQTCGVTACFDGNLAPMTCPSSMTAACARPTTCYAGGAAVSCDASSCGVSQCYSSTGAAMTCPTDVTDACPVATYCYRNGESVSCDASTCGATSCYNQAWQPMTCPANVADACTLSYEGWLDAASCSGGSGWVWSPSLPNTPLRVEILDGDTVLTTVDANGYRGDLQAVGKGNGVHAFSYSYPGYLGTHDISVRVVGTSFRLYGGPKQITCRCGADVSPVGLFTARFRAQTSAQCPFPEVVKLVNRATNSICTGTVIGDKTVLTAAHCGASGQTLEVEGPPVVNGEAPTGTLTTWPGFDVNQYLNLANAANWLPDVAVLKLKYSSTIAPAAIASAAPAIGTPTTVVGFGETSFGAGDAGTKRMGNNAVTFLTGGFLKHVGKSQTQSVVCGGDSGGPVLRGQTPWTTTRCVLGIISFGDPTNGNCDSAGSFHTLVSPVAWWIRANASPGDIIGGC